MRVFIFLTALAILFSCNDSYRISRSEFSNDEECNYWVHRSNTPRVTLRKIDSIRKGYMNEGRLSTVDYYIVESYRDVSHVFNVVLFNEQELPRAYSVYPSGEVRDTGVFYGDSANYRCLYDLLVLKDTSFLTDLMGESDVLVTRFYREGGRDFKSESYCQRNYSCFSYQLQSSH